MPGSKRGLEVGFTSELFEGCLWKERDRIMVSLMISLKPGQGNFRGLVERILAMGYAVAVPTPSRSMRRILEKNGFRQTWERDEASMSNCEVWVREPEQKEEDKS